MGHKVEKMESRSKIVTKSQQSLLNKSNRIEIRSFLSSAFDKLDCTRFAHVNYQTPSFRIMGHKVEKMESSSKIVTKSQQSLLKKSNKKEICSFLPLDIDRLDYVNDFRTSIIRLRLFHFMGHKMKKTSSF